jgi:hypothetical protein
MKPHIRIATEQDCFDLAPRLRAADVAELAALGDDPLVALLSSYEVSPLVWAAEYDQQVHVIFGVAPFPDNSGAGSPWLLASERVSEFAVQFLRESYRYIPKMHMLYPTLRNYVHAMNVESIMWLRWLGFSFTRVIHSPHDADQLFIEFEKNLPCAKPLLSA